MKTIDMGKISTKLQLEVNTLSYESLCCKGFKFYASI